MTTCVRYIVENEGESPEVRDSIFPNDLEASAVGVTTIFRIMPFKIEVHNGKDWVELPLVKQLLDSKI